MKKSTFNLNVPWGHIAAKAWGDVENTKVLMVHGYLDNSGVFDRLITMLPQNFYYVCIDLPGHGFSSHYPKGTVLSFTNYLLAIKFVLDELKWEHAYYIGHSYGAQLGFYFSLTYPDRIRKLVLIDGIMTKVILNNEIIPRIKFEHDLSVQSERNNEYTKEQIIYAFQNLRDSYLISEAAEALFERSVVKVGENSYSYSRDKRLKGMISPLFNMELQCYLVAHITVETLIIVVTDTLKFQQDNAFTIINTLKDHKNVKVIKVKGNHDVHNNYPERISEHISRFISYIPSKL